MRLVPLASLLAACTTFSAPTPEMLARLQPPDSRESFRATASVTIDTDALRGTFDAVLVADPAGPRVRLQLFPDVGGKVLDLIATPERFFGRVGGESIDCAPGDAPRSLLTFMAFTLLEMFAPVVPDRVRGQRGDVEFDVAPVAGALQVHYRPDGGHRFSYRFVRWALRDHHVRGRGFSLQIESIRKERARLSPSVFRP